MPCFCRGRSTKLTPLRARRPAKSNVRLSPVRPVTTIDVDLCIAAGPWLNDHFPGDPLVPGAVLLDEISAALRAAVPQFGMLTGIAQARFLQPVRPPAALRVQAQCTSGHADFTAIDLTTGVPAVRGSFRFAGTAAVNGV